MKTEFVYFDLDNTLLDHSSAEEEAHREIYQTFDEFRDVSLSAWLSTYKEINKQLWLQYQKGEVDRFQLQRSRFRDSMKGLGLSYDRSEAIGTAYMEVYRQYWKWVPGAEEALSRVTENYPVGFITNGFKETQQKKIDYLNLKRFSDKFIISEDVGVMKPHPKVFEVATGISTFRNDQILYVGDSYSSDIIGGRNAGWKTAWYTAFVEEYQECMTADICFEEFPVLIDYLIH
jgi:YjjG family noncanonical pyrimidine nucleotidase